MSVPSARQVFGPTRKQFTDWWEPDQKGKPLTPLMAEAIRARGLNRKTHAIEKALARRGLLNPPDWNDLRASRLTPEGERLRALLGVVPVGESLLVWCNYCGRGTDRGLIAWGVSERARRCIECATLEVKDD